VDEHIRQLRAELAALELRRLEAESELAAALVEAGRRPGDGSDQPALFTVDAPGLFE
jgi:hypothetical protein